MTMMKTVIGALEKAGIRDKTRVMIGGAPITQQFAEEIGADGFSDNASSAVAFVVDGWVTVSGTSRSNPTRRPAN